MTGEATGAGEGQGQGQTMKGPGRAYHFVRRLLALLVHVFFRQIAIVGSDQIPGEGQGPVIFAGNHPNSLIDPVLMVVSAGRVVHFAAKDVLFRSRLLRPILQALGAVPIARRMDHPGREVDNQSAFERLFGVLEGGGAIGIFPEGISHDQTQLQRLKTGAARIALGVVARNAARGLSVRIVPCGLTYITPKRFRSRVLVQFGTPIVVDANRLGSTVSGDAVDEDAARALTGELERRLRGLTINAPDWETLRVLDGVRRLYQPPSIGIDERVELARRFNDVYPTVRTDPEVQTAYRRVEEYLDRLEAVGIRDRDLQRRIGPREAAARIARHLLLSFVWLPLALPGMVIHAPVGLLAGLAGRLLTPRSDVAATTKLLVGTALIGLAHLALVPLGYVAGGWPLAAGVLVALPLTGWALVAVRDRTVSLRRATSTLARLLWIQQEIDELRVERVALEAEISRIVERVRPAEMVPLFPRDPGPEGP